MILRRLTKHIKDQNWFAVGLDFLIVVIGVLIAIQLANWDEARQERNRASALLERLESDFQEMRALAVEQNSGYYRNTVNLDELLTRIEDEQDPISDAEAGQLLNDGLFFRLPQATPISFQEMLSAGRLELLQDAELRVKLREYANTSRTIENASNLVANGYVVIVGELAPYFTTIRAPNENSSQLVSDIGELNVAELREDPRPRALVSQMFLGQANMQSLTASQIASIDEVLEAIHGFAEPAQ
ncbi:hypothetical protein [Hyphomonas sp.]|uniref:hypothetical protein n=1 Tax=Hyphomonas sp. TaxID=87 RepID=UPI003F70EE25|tara:strand:- start:26377 stop:27108 length:732 start_codon:yes stop_codon:yes gene_type:complete